jgi:hypothetical protein
LQGLWFDLVRDVLAAAPAGVVLLGGLVAAVFVARKSPVAAVLFLLGLLALAMELLLQALTPTVLVFAGRTGPVAFAIYDVVTAVIRGFGILLCLVAACVGPAPKRADEEEF